jgi:hypothetical protein
VLWALVLWSPSIVYRGSLFFQDVNEKRGCLQAKYCGGPCHREIRDFILTRLGTGHICCTVWLLKNVQCHCHITGRMYTCGICNCVSSTTWNLKMEVESAPETWCVVGILQTMGSAQLNKGIMSPLVHENYPTVERRETQCLRQLVD